MFLAETKGLTHWFLLYDGAYLHAWNLVRDRHQLLLPVSNMKAMAVDPLRGYLFLATTNRVHRYSFAVELGYRMMQP